MRTSTGSGLIFLLLTACPAPNTEPDPPAPPSPTLGDFAPTCATDVIDCAEYDDGTLIFDDETGEGIRGVELGAEGRMRLTVDDPAEWLARLTPGTVMIRQRGDRTPFLRRVVEARAVDDAIELETERARLKDAFRRGRFRRKVRVASQDDVLNTQPLTLGCDVEFPFANNQGRVGLRGCSLDVDVELEVTGSWGFEQGDFGEVVVVGEVVAGTEVFLEFDGSAAFAGERSLQKKVVPLLPVPGLADLIIETRAGYNVGVTGTATATTGFDYVGSLRAGAGYMIGDGLYGVWEPASDFDRRPFELSAQATVAGEVYVKPTFAFAAFSTLEASVGVKVYGATQISADATVKEEIGGELSVDADLCYDVSVGVKPVIEVEASLLGVVQLASVELSPPPHFQTSLLNECVEVNATTGAVCGASDACQVDADCAPVDACHVASCADCQCAQRALADCCLDDADCAVDELVGRLDPVCRANRCEHALVTGGCSDDADCNDDRPETEDRCVVGTNARRTCEHELTVEPVATPLGVHRCRTAAACDDGDASTIDACTLRECEHTPVPPCGGSCDDGDPATTDACVDDACTHTRQFVGATTSLPIRR
jgi:hypothetical protein